VRRELRHPGAQLTFEDIDGCRFTALVTDKDGAAVSWSGATAPARCEDRIRCPKTLGLRTCPAATSNATRCGCN
jgi:hypothetical protein